MNKSELCAHVAARAGVSRMTADTVVSTAFSMMIGEALARDETVVSGCAKARINGEQQIPHPAICGAGDDSERWVGI